MHLIDISKLARAALGVLAVVVLTSHCKIATHSSGVVGQCVKGTCGHNQEYRKGVCETARCDNKKNGNADCCPGQFCRFDGTCTDIVTECASNTDCTAGQICQSRAEVDSKKNICSWPFPTTSGQCPAGYQLFNKRCIHDAPCGGICQSKQFCDIETNTCEDLPSIPTSDSSCEISCKSGKVKVLTDPDVMTFHQCCALQCECATLPPLQVGSFGKYAHGAIDNNEILIASYDETYGDLVLSHHRKDNGALVQVEFVDGVPKAGTVTGDVAGPRQGIKDPGPDVGRYSSLVIASDDIPRVVYYDSDNHVLKYAQKKGTTWNSFVLDTPGDVGKYSAFMTDGSHLRLAYMVQSAAKKAGGDAAPVTALRYAETANLNPTGASDFTFVDIDIRSAVSVPCGGSCQPTDTCVVDSVDGKEKCAANATDCTSIASDGQVCAKIDGATTSGIYTEDAIPHSTGIPLGVGLYPSMAIDSADQRLLIAYYDNATPKNPPFLNNKGSLKLASLRMDATTGLLPSTLVPDDVRVTVLDNGKVCDDATDYRDVGQFASLKVAASGRIGVAYLETSRPNDPVQNKLRFLELSQLPFSDSSFCYQPKSNSFSNTTSSIIATVVDNGIRNVGIEQVGADASLIFIPTGTDWSARIAYQDATAQTVLLAKEGSPWATSTLLGNSDNRSHGFFINLLTDTSGSWLVDVRLGFDAQGNVDDAVSVTPVSSKIQ